MTDTTARTPGVSIKVNWTMAGVVLALLVQTATLIAWGARMDERVAALEQKIASAQALSDTVARVDERTKALQTTVDRIDQRLSDTESRR